MLIDAEVDSLLARLGLPEVGREYVKATRSSPPSRRTDGGECSMSCLFLSEKMNFVVKPESRTHELVYARVADYDDSILEFWDQPLPIRLNTTDRHGRRHGHWYRPDYLTLKSNIVEVVEIKPSAILQRRVVTRPQDWQFADGAWHYVPAEDAVKSFGFTHKTYSTEDLCPKLAQNIMFLKDYWRPTTPSVDREVTQAIQEFIAQSGKVLLRNLLPPQKPWGADAVYTLIATGQLACDINNELLADPNRCWIYADKATFVIASDIQKLRVISECHNETRARE